MQNVKIVLALAFTLFYQSMCTAAPIATVTSHSGFAAPVWLDELDFRTLKQGILQPQRNRAVQGSIISINGIRYERGIGMHAPSRFTLAVKKRAVSFEAEVGVDDEKKTLTGSVQFIVMGDGRELWRSPVMNTGDPAQHISVDIKGVTELELVSGDAGDGNDSDHADWANAKLSTIAPVDDLYPGGMTPATRSKLWNLLSPQQKAKGYKMETIAPGVWRLRFGTPEKITPVSMRSEPIKVDGFTQLPASNVMPFPTADVGFRPTGRGCLVDLPMESNEQVFGFGMNFKVLNATGMRRAMRVTDAPETEMGDSHAPVPFYVSTRGYGVFIDTARWAQFYCGNLQLVGNNTGNADSHGIATSTEELYKQRDINEKRMTVDVPAAKGVDVYVFAGPTMAEAVQRYVLFSGGGCLPPLWGLGVWYRCSTEFKAPEALKMAHQLRDSKIPCDVFGLEPGWQSQAYPCSFEWSKERFPDPKEFAAELSSLGLHLNLWEHAFTHPSSPIYTALKSHSGDYSVWGGLVPDFADPKARTIFGDHHGTTFVKQGVSGFKLDECDNQPLAPKPWSWPEVTAFPSGADGEQMHSLLPVLYQRTLTDVYKRNNIRTYGQVRATHALAAPLPFVLYSDAYDHRSYVRGIVTCGLSGTLWQPEVRDCDSVEELYRRLQTAVCSPQTLVNAWYLRNFPWRQIHKDENNRGVMMPGYEKV